MILIFHVFCVLSEADSDLVSVLMMTMFGKLDQF